MKVKWIILLLFFLTIQLFGENFNENNRGLSVLEINTSPVSISLGGGYSVMGQTVVSFLDNPAMLANINCINTVFNHEEMGFNIRRDDIFFSKRITSKMGLMMGIGYYNGGSIELRDIIPEDVPYSTTGFSDFIIGTAIGYEIYNELKVGIGCKFVSQYAYIYSGMGVSFDAGILFNPSILKELKISVIFNNFGPTMGFGQSQKVTQPTRVKFAMGRRFKLPKLRSDIGVSIGGYSKYYVIPYNDTAVSASENIRNFFKSIPDRAVTDIDFDYLINKKLDFRISYLIGGENTIANLGLGLILNRFRFDYSYTLEETTNGTHRMSIGVNY